MALNAAREVFEIIRASFALRRPVSPSPSIGNYQREDHNEYFARHGNGEMTESQAFPAVRFRQSSEMMNHTFFSTDTFVAGSIKWLSSRLGDLHLEFHECEGWSIATCCNDKGEWSESGWLRGDGSLASALCVAIEVQSKLESDTPPVPDSA